MLTFTVIARREPCTCAHHNASNRSCFNTRFTCRYKTIKARCPTTDTLDFPDVPHGFFTRGSTSDDVVAAAVGKCGQAITSFIGKHFE